MGERIIDWLNWIIECPIRIKTEKYCGLHNCQKPQSDRSKMIPLEGVKILY